MANEKLNPVVEVTAYAAHAYATMLIISAAPELAADVREILESGVKAAPEFVKVVGNVLVTQWLASAQAEHASRQPVFQDEAAGEGDAE